MFHKFHMLIVARKICCDNLNSNNLNSNNLNSNNLNSDNLNSNNLNSNNLNSNNLNSDNLNSNNRKKSYFTNTETSIPLKINLNCLKNIRNFVFVYNLWLCSNPFRSIPMGILAVYF